MQDRGLGSSARTDPVGSEPDASPPLTPTVNANSGPAGAAVSTTASATATPTNTLAARQPVPEFRRIVSFSPRSGRLNDVQRRAWAAHAPSWLIERPEGLLDQRAVFGRRAPLVVEIGSGMGESTAAMAAARPDIDLLAVEVYKPGVAQTLNHLARRGVDSVRLLRADVVDVLTEDISPASLAEVWLFFPDPWPKTKHFKRRLVTPAFVDLVTSRLQRGGVFRLATDWAPYAEQMLAVCSSARGLRNAHPGWAARPSFRPRTRFEQRGLVEGREIFDLEFFRR